MSILRRFLNLWRGRSLDSEFDDELHFHLEMRIESNLRGGLSRRDAEAEARRHLGSALFVKEGMREARMIGWLDTMSRDVRHGLRLYRRYPVLAGLAVLTLALGIGANTAIFSLLNAVLFRPLPFPQPERLAAVLDGFRTQGLIGTGPTVPEFLDVRARARSFESLSFFDTRDFQITGGGEPARVFAARAEAFSRDAIAWRCLHTVCGSGISAEILRLSGGRLR
jgi:hypothetical protein